MSKKERGEILEELGYDCYRDYLKSDLWTEIRDRVLKESNYECICCDNKSIGNADGETLVMQVHHMVYTEDNLSGNSLYGLVAICLVCHMKAEFKQPIFYRKGKRGAKRTLAEANSYVLDIGGQREKERKKKEAEEIDRGVGFDSVGGSMDRQTNPIRTKCKICKVESDTLKEVCTYCENQLESTKWFGGNE